MNAIHFIIAKFNRNTFAKDTAILTFGTLVTQLLGIATIPIMSRLYSPADFGKLAIFAAVVLIVATVITLRYEMKILLPKVESQANDLIVLKE